MKFNFQKTANARLTFQREFSFEDFFNKCLAPYENVAKDDSPQFQQSQLRSEKRTISNSNIAFLESIVLDFDDCYTDKQVHDILEKLKSYGLSFIFYDTASSKPDDRRFRLMFETGEYITPKEYRKLSHVVSLGIINIKPDEQGFSAHQRYKLANKGGIINKGMPLNEFMSFEKVREAIKAEERAPKPSYEKKDIDIVLFVLNKYDLETEGERNTNLNRALFLARKLGGERTELEEIARASTLPENEKRYVLERNLKK